jgi:hypothetical protein
MSRGYSGGVVRTLALLVSLAAVALLAGCGSDEETAGPTTTAQSPPVTTAPPASGGEEDGVRGSAGAMAAGPPAVGDPVPDLVGTSLDGKPIALSDFRGKKVIVNLWSSW